MLFLGSRILEGNSEGEGLSLLRDEREARKEKGIGDVEVAEEEGGKEDEQESDLTDLPEPFSNLTIRSFPFIFLHLLP
jgi:hypothetical protein